MPDNRINCDLNPGDVLRIFLQNLEMIYVQSSFGWIVAVFLILARDKPVKRQVEVGCKGWLAGWHAPLTGLRSVGRGVAWGAGSHLALLVPGPPSSSQLLGLPCCRLATNGQSLPKHHHPAKRSVPVNDTLRVILINKTLQYIAHIKCRFVKNKSVFEFVLRMLFPRFVRRFDKISPVILKACFFLDLFMFIIVNKLESF